MTSVRRCLGACAICWRVARGDGWGRGLRRAAAAAAAVVTVSLDAVELDHGAACTAITAIAAATFAAEADHGACHHRRGRPQSLSLLLSPAVRPPVRGRLVVPGFMGETKFRRLRGLSRTSAARWLLSMRCVAISGCLRWPGFYVQSRCTS